MKWDRFFSNQCNRKKMIGKMKPNENVFKELSNGFQFQQVFSMVARTSQLKVRLIFYAW